MKRTKRAKEWLPLARGSGKQSMTPDGTAFRSEWIDFDRGIRMGNLEPYERITQIVKHHLQQRYGQPFICDKWGRGSFWQWICWVPRRNREAKPISSDGNWSCAKFFITVDRDDRVFSSGLQVERGPAAGSERFKGCMLKPDWDWHRLVKQLRKGSAFDRELHRLIKQEQFVATIGNWDRLGVFEADSFSSAGQLRRSLSRVRDEEWAGFMLYYPMPEKEVAATSGPELAKAIFAVFGEVAAAMDLVMQVPLAESTD